MKFTDLRGRGCALKGTPKAIIRYVEFVRNVIYFRVIARVKGVNSLLMRLSMAVYDWFMVWLIYMS